MTTRLNRSELPFSIKVLDDPSRFTRCDAAVLYVEKETYLEVVDRLAEVYREVAHFLKPETPVFTKSLCTGVGLAEDPGRSESFGQHRCRLLAEGAVRCHEQGVRSLEMRLASCRRLLRGGGGFPRDAVPEPELSRRLPVRGVVMNPLTQRPGLEPATLLATAETIGRRICSGPGGTKTAATGWGLSLANASTQGIHRTPRPGRSVPTCIRAPVGSPCSWGSSSP